MSMPYSLPNALLDPNTILDTVLGHLAILFLSATGGDVASARHVANQMLAAYNPETTGELHLAAEIISFSAHALEALGQAAAAGLSLAKILRLRGSAVSLSREAHKSRRRLDQLQTARRAGKMTEVSDEAAFNTVAATTGSASEAARTTCPRTRDTVIEPKRPVPRNPAQTWTQGYQQRQAAKRIAQNLKRNQSAAKAIVQAEPQIAAVEVESISQ